MMRLRASLIIVALLFTATAHAQIYRWDNGQVIPGTEGITPGVHLGMNEWNSESHNLRYADFSGGLDLSGAYFSANWLDYASFQGANLSHASFTGLPLGGGPDRPHGNSLTNANLSRTNLSDADLRFSSLTNADLNGAVVTGARFQGQLTQEQLYSTASYLAQDLHGIVLQYNDLNGWDFHGQNLTGAELWSTTLTDANLRGALLNSAMLLLSTLDNANITEADLRGASWDGGAGAIVKNTILPDGVVLRLVVADQEWLAIRDDDGIPDPAPTWWLTPRDPISITVHDMMSILPGSTLQLVFAGNDWGSTIKFEHGIPVQLGGTLELTFTDNTQLATQSGRTIKAFDWTAVTPQGHFTLQAQPGTAWDTSKLYSTGELTLLGISSDLNSDKDVDSEDLLDFLANWTGPEYPAADKSWQTGDSDEDGDVDSADMLVFLSQWTGAAAAEVQSVASVPEPSGASLIGIAAAGLLMSTRRRVEVQR